MRRSLCLFLAICIAYFSLPFFAFAADTEPTEGPVSGLQGASPVAVEANSAIASALIGAGVQPGTNLDDFNMLVSSCVTAMESDGMFTDGKIAFVSNNVDGVQYMYAPVHLIDAVRNWLLDDSGAVFDKSLELSPTAEFTFGSGSYIVQSSGIPYCVVCFKYTSNPNNPIYTSYGVFALSNVSFAVRYSVNGGSFSSYNSSVKGSRNWYRKIVGGGSGEIDLTGLYVVDVGIISGSLSTIDSALASHAGSFAYDDLGYGSSLDLYISDLSPAGYSSWLGTSVDYDGATFVPCSVMNTYDDTIQLPQEYVQGGITDYTPPVPPDVTVPDWESPDVPQYPGSDSAPPDNELLWGIRVAVLETIPYWIKTTAGTIVEWLQRIYNHITDTVAGLVGVLSTQHDALLAKLDELKAGFGGESSAGDELQSEVDRVDSELDEMTDIMNSVTRPDVDSIDTDISEHIDQANLTLLATPFTAMMTDGPFSTMVFITLTLVLCAYVLYGKR